MNWTVQVKSMKSLLSLFFVKKKAKIRGLFKKPVAGILTVVIVAASLYMLIPAFKTKGKVPMDDLTTSVFVIALLFLAVLICLMIFLQKKQALFFEEDSYYLFIGPFSNRQILLYSVIDCLFSSVITALFCMLIPFIAVAAKAIMPLSYLFLGLFVTTLVIFIFSMLSQYIYLKDLIRGTVSRIRKMIGLAIIVIILAFVGYSYLSSELNIRSGLINFVLSKEFYYVPVLGWAKYALEGLGTNDATAMIVGSGLLFLTGLILSLLMIHTKGNFYEQAMVDAVEFSENYKKAMRGETADTNKKMYDASVRYQQGEGAIFSKSLLVLKKSREVFSKQDFLSLFFVGMLGFTVAPNLLIYGGFILFYLMNTSGMNALIEELKVNYIYLIPGNPLKKLLNCLYIPIFKTLLLSTLMTGLSYFIFDVSFVELLIAVLVIASFVFVFYAADIFGIRFLKNQSNKLLEQSLRMLTLVVACGPSFGLIWGIHHLTGNIMMNLPVMALIVIAFNLVISSVVIYCCSSMMNGNAYTAE